jgi:hypothetical protein
MSANPYLDFIKDRSLEPCSLGGIHFHLNPSSFSYDTEFIHAEVNTLAGYGTFRYGIKAPLITMDGFTGIAGLDGINRLKQFRALPGVVPTLLPFRFPNRFGDQIHYVWINTLVDSMADSMHLYNSYKIELVEFPRDSTPSVRTLSSTLGTDIASIISSGPLTLPASPGGGVAAAQPNPSYTTLGRGGGHP